MTQNRREWLGSLGLASASTWLWALGCGGAASSLQHRPVVSGAVRSWLRDAVVRLAAVYPSVHVLAVSRRRTTAAIDVLGTGVARVRRDGVVLSVRDRSGMWHDQVTSDLDERGIATAVRALVGSSTARASIAFPAPALPPAEPITLDDERLAARVQAITNADPMLNSRIVYAAAMIDIDDAHVWSISPTHDREQRVVRVLERAMRAAWNGTRPLVSDVERGWTGGIDDLAISAEAVRQATADALLLTTPGAFDDKARTVVLDPSVTASLVDASTRALLTTATANQPAGARRLVGGAVVASPLVTLIDDPTAAGAYGGFAFDDEGALAAPLTLVEDGRFAATLGETGRGRARRPGHLGPIAPAPSHLRLAPGTVRHTDLHDDGLILEGAQGAVVDPTTDRVVIGAARAREVRNGVLTGRVHADVELAGSMSQILANISGVAADTAILPFRDELDGEPRWRSIEAPYLRTTGFVRARRRPA